jgi:hypothetical protein
METSYGTSGVTAQKAGMFKVAMRLDAEHNLYQSFILI